MEIYGPVKLSGSLANGAGDPVLTKDGTSNEVGTTTNTIGTLAEANIFVGNASDEPVAVAVSGDITISNAGVVAIASGVIVNADVHATAAIALTKLAATTASRAIVSDGDGFFVPATTTATEIGYVNGVTSAIQTQLDGKQATITGAASTVVSSNLTANTVAIINSSGKIDVSATTDTELGYVAGVTSAIQDQLDAKLEPDLSSVAEGDILYFNGTDWINLARGTNGQALYSTATSIQWDTPTINGIPVGGTAGQVLYKDSGTDFDADWATLETTDINGLLADAAELNILDGVTASTAEINLLVGASGNIQSQLNNKLSTSLTTDSIYKGVGGLATATTDLPTGITIGGAVIYRVGGSDVTLADGGTGASLADPNADRIMFWDDSGGAVTWLRATSGVTVSGTDVILGGTLAASTTITSNTASGFNLDGAWTSGATNQYHYRINPTITSNTNNEVLQGVFINPTWAGTGTGLSGNSTQARRAIDSRGPLFISTTAATDLFASQIRLQGTVSTGSSGGTGTSISIAGSIQGGGNNPDLKVIDITSTLSSGAYSATASAIALDINPTTTSLFTNGLTMARLKGDVTQSSGTGNYTGLEISPTYNSTASFSGTFRALDYNPTETALTGITHYGITVRSTTALNGLGTASPTAILDLAASTTARASLRIRDGVAPTSPNNGDIWSDGSDLFVRLGGVTYTIQKA